jgi:uncharacterized protein YjdB
MKAFGAASQDIAKTKAAVRKVDIDNKIQEQKLKKAFSSQGKRISGTEYALAASTVIDKLREEFPKFKENEIVNTILASAPVLFQKPIKQEFYKDPRLIATALTAGIAIFKEIQDKNKQPESVQNITIFPPIKTIIVGNSFSLTAVARDKNGNKVKDKTFSWFPSDEGVATVTKEGNLGNVTGNKIGNVNIYAVEDSSGKTNNVEVRVVKGPS